MECRIILKIVVVSEMVCFLHLFKCYYHPHNYLLSIAVSPKYYKSYYLQVSDESGSKIMNVAEQLLRIAGSLSFVSFLFDSQI